MSPTPFDTGTLDVGDGHVLYYEQVGSPGGAPVVYLHGGPGSGVTPAARELFDPVGHRAVLFDQRGAGRSTPHASDPDLDWRSIDLDHHVLDIERLRTHLGIERGRSTAARGAASSDWRTPSGTRSGSPPSSSEPSAGAPAPTSTG